MEEGDHVSFWLVRGGGGKRKIKRMRQTWSWFFLLWACFLDLGICQDQIRLKSGEVIQGTAVKFDENSMTLTFRFSKGTLGYSQTDLAEVNLAERPGVAEGRKALSAGQWDQVVDKWKTAVDELMGVDSPWVLECAGGLGQAYLAQGRVADAESLYVKMKRFYPNGSAALRADVGLAEATAGKDTDGLLKKLQLLECQLQEGLRPVRADREALAEYYFARGQAYEKKEEWKKALEDYLRVSALYPEPPSLGQRAEQRAQALRQSRKDLVTD
jgi:tetratricopeptide (TPR) repeat protein